MSGLGGSGPVPGCGGLGGLGCRGWRWLRGFRGFRASEPAGVKGCFRGSSLGV